MPAEEVVAAAVVVVVPVVLVVVAVPPGGALTVTKEKLAFVPLTSTISAPIQRKITASTIAQKTVRDFRLRLGGFTANTSGVAEV